MARVNGLDLKAELVRRGIRLKDAAAAVGYSANYLYEQLGRERPVSPRLSKCLRLLLANHDATTDSRAADGHAEEAGA